MLGTMPRSANFMIAQAVRVLLTLPTRKLLCGPAQAGCWWMDWYTPRLVSPVQWTSRPEPSSSASDAFGTA